MAHLSRQQGLVIEGFLKLGIGVLAFDGDSEQTCKACEKICICVVELSGIVTQLRGHRTARRPRRRA